MAEQDPGVVSDSQTALQKLRGVYESALSAGGLHLSLGSQLWKICRCSDLTNIETVSQEGLCASINP